MTPAIKVLLIEDNRLEARLTQHWLASAKDPLFDVDSVDQLQAGIERLTHGGIDIVLLDLNLPDSRGLETFEKLHEKSPQVPVVVLTGEYDESIGPLAVEKGAQDYLVKQQVDGLTLNRVLRHALARSHAYQEEINKLQSSRRSLVIGFIGAKGGVGTTTTALNIALALSLQGKQTILVELRPSFGTLSCHLKRKPSANLKTLLDMPPEQIGAVELGSVLHQHHQVGLQILFGPQHAKDAKEIDPRQAVAIINGLSEMADYVLLDLPNQPSAATHDILHLCHSVVIVTEAEPAAVESGKIAIDQFQSMGIGGGILVGIIVNRTVFSVPIKFAEVGSEMGCPIVGIIPSATNACQQSLREGSPLVILQRDNEAALSLTQIAEKIAIDKLVDFNP